MTFDTSVQKSGALRGLKTQGQVPTRGTIFCNMAPKHGHTFD